MTPDPREWMVGVDLGGTKIESVVLDANGHQLARHRAPTPRGDYPGTVRAVAALVAEVRRMAMTRVAGNRDIDKWQLQAVGVGTPGSLRPGFDVMQNCNSECLNGQPLAADLSQALGCRVMLANDADCFVLSEAKNGAAVDHNTAFGVILGTGVGGGLVVNGALVTGPNGLTGEWGHVTMPPRPVSLSSAARSGEKEVADETVSKRDHEQVSRPLDARVPFPGAADCDLEAGLRDRRCYCGRVNCVETFLSGPGLERTHRELSGEERSVKWLATLSTDQARCSIELYCRMLARALSLVVNIIDPEIIVLGGGVSNMPVLYTRLSELIGEHVFAGTCRTPIVVARHGDSSGVLGAAFLVRPRA